MCGVTGKEVIHMNLKTSLQQVVKMESVQACPAGQGQQGATNIVVDGIAYLPIVVGW